MLEEMTLNSDLSQGYALKALTGNILYYYYYYYVMNYLCFCVYNQCELR